MNRVRSIRSVRRAAVTRLFAAALIVLVASPFTAPFSTCDSAELAGEGSVHVDGSPDCNTSQYVTVSTIGPATILLLPLGIVQQAGGPMVHVGADPLVLRL